MAKCKACGKNVCCSSKLKNGLCATCRSKPTTTSTDSTAPIIKKITFTRK